MILYKCCCSIEHKTCLGKDLSFIKIKMIAIAILCNFPVLSVEGQAPTLIHSIVLLMKNGLKVRITKRENWWKRLVIPVETIINSSRNEIYTIILWQLSNNFLFYIYTVLLLSLSFFSLHCFLSSRREKKKVVLKVFTKWLYKYHFTWWWLWL